MRSVFSGLTLFLLGLLVPLGVNAVGVDAFRITTDGSQQSGPRIYKNLVYWTDWRGGEETSLDIYGYDLDEEREFPVLVKEGQQWLAGFNRRWLVYNEYFGVEDLNSYDVRVKNLRTGQDLVIAGGEGSQSAEDLYRNTVVYIEGGACGKLFAYDLRRQQRKLLTEEACSPVRMWMDTVVWAYGAPGGSNVYGYDLRKNRLFEVASDEGFQEVPDIYRNQVVWLHREGDTNAIYLKDLRKGNVRLLHQTTGYAMNYPTISRRYVVWSKSTAQHVGGVEGVDLRTGEVFEIQGQGPHQNSTTTPDIWEDTTVWQAWRTGNGDVYGAELIRQ